ncbi:MAG: hypothetical protein P4L46_11455 [Fimbriimonas sp.]|nr:hypothetical protein [Fimbriimonas sp.]
MSIDTINALRIASISNQLGKLSDLSDGDRQRLMNAVFQIDVASGSFDSPASAVAACNQILTIAAAADLPNVDNFLNECDSLAQRLSDYNETLQLTTENYDDATKYRGPSEDGGDVAEATVTFLAAWLKPTLVQQEMKQYWDSPDQISPDARSALQGLLFQGLAAKAGLDPTLGTALSDPGIQSQITIDVPQTYPEARAQLTPRQQNIVDLYFDPAGNPVAAANYPSLLPQSLVAIYQDDLAKYKADFEIADSLADESEKAQSFDELNRRVQAESAERAGALKVLGLIAGNSPIGKAILVAQQVNTAVTAIQSFLLPAATMGPFGLAAALGGAIFGILGIFGGGSDGFQQISKQISDMQSTMIRGFQQVEELEQIILKALEAFSSVVITDLARLQQAVNEIRNGIATLTNYFIETGQDTVSSERLNAELRAKTAVLQILATPANSALLIEYQQPVETIRDFVINTTPSVNAAGLMAGTPGDFASLMRTSNRPEEMINGPDFALAVGGIPPAQLEIANPIQFQAGVDSYSYARLQYPQGQDRTVDNVQITSMLQAAQRHSDSVSKAMPDSLIQSIVSRYLHSLNAIFTQFGNDSRDFYTHPNDPANAKQIPDVLVDYSTGKITRTQVSSWIKPTIDNPHTGNVRYNKGTYYGKSQRVEDDYEILTYAYVVSNDPIQFCITNGLIECPTSANPSPLALTGIGTRILAGLPSACGVDASSILTRAQDINVQLSQFVNPGNDGVIGRSVGGTDAASDIAHIQALIDLCTVLRIAYWADCRVRLLASVSIAGAIAELDSPAGSAYSAMVFIYLLRLAVGGQRNGERMTYLDVPLPISTPDLAARFSVLARRIDADALTSLFPTLGSPSGAGSQIGMGGPASLTPALWSLLSSKISTECNLLVSNSSVPVGTKHPSFVHSASTLGTLAAMLGVTLT